MRRQGTAHQTHNKHPHSRRTAHTCRHAPALRVRMYTSIQLCVHVHNAHSSLNNIWTWTFSWFAAFTKTHPSQTWLMSLKGQKIKLNIPHVSHVNHSMVSCIYNLTAISEIIALKRRTKYPCITAMKYRPKNPRLYFSEIKPLGLIHIQSLVSSWAVGLYNLVVMAIIGESSFVLVSCVMRAWTRSVELTYIWLHALSAQSKSQLLSCFVLQAPSYALWSSSRSNAVSVWNVSCACILPDEWCRNVPW